VSSLFQVLASISEMEGNKGLNFEYLVVESSKFIRVKREALLKIKMQANHLMRIILTRFKRVTIPICKRFLVNFLPELGRIASKSITNIPIEDEEMDLKAKIDGFLGFECKSNFSIREIKTGETSRNPILVLEGKVALDNSPLGKGYSNLYFQ